MGGVSEDHVTAPSGQWKERTRSKGVGFHEYSKAGTVRSTGKPFCCLLYR